MGLPLDQRSTRASRVVAGMKGGGKGSDDQRSTRASPACFTQIQLDNTYRFCYTVGMRPQNQIKRTLRESIEQVRHYLCEHPDCSRNALAAGLCRKFHFLDVRGVPQQASCLKALRELADEGCFELPAPRIVRKGAPPPRRLSEPVPLPVGVPDRVDEVRNLSLRLVETEEEYRRWNEVILREHPYGERRLMGRQLRYLIESDHGCLGAVGFSAAACALQERDRWIGWNPRQRAAHLDQVVCLSRLLIRPGVTCVNLVSKILGRLHERFPGDFETRYGYRPWLLETFVEADLHDGASFRAANWTAVGQTRGRGRQDRENQHSQTVKEIFLYVLDESFRTRLGVPVYQRHPPEGPEEGLAETKWAHHEFGGAKLGDLRLSRRLVSIAETKGSAPGRPFAEVVDGQAAPLAGYYRFLDQPDDSKVAMGSILAPHRHRTLCRMQGQSEVLCIHDTTDLNYATLLACEGLGVIGKNQTQTESAGLRLHSSYVVSAKEGLPLGLLAWKCYAPELKGDEHPEKDPRQVPMEEKVSYRWIENLRECVEQTGDLVETRITHVTDREGDFFELFDQWREAGKDHLLVRAKNNRSLAAGRVAPKLFDTVSALEVMDEVEVTIPRKSARGKKGNQKARNASPKRTACMELRWMPMEVRPPRFGLSAKKTPVPAWVLHAREKGGGPADGKPIEWCLLSSSRIDDREDAIRVLGYYAKRWRIEDWHRILKTCCRVEEPAHQDAECLKRLVAMNMVIAWRIHIMTLLGREMPDLPVETLFDEVEIRVLELWSKQRGWAVPRTLGDAVITVARIGGYMHRNHDPPPGAELLWRGLQQLTLLSQGLRLASLQ